MLVPVAVAAPYTYRAPVGTRAGDIVVAPLGTREVVGVVWADPPDARVGHNRLRAIGGVVVFETKNGCHLAFAGWHGGLHELATQLHQFNGIKKVQAFRCNQRTVLTQAVPGDKVRRLTSCYKPLPPERDARRQQRWLGNRGLIKLFRRAMLAQVPEIIPQHIGGFGKRFFYDRPVLGCCSQHTDRLRSLSGKNKG